MTKVLLDTNILIYSIDQESIFYPKAKKFMENLLESEVEIYLPDKAIYEFYRVLSSPVFVKRLEKELAKNIWRSFAFSEFFEIIYSNEAVLRITDKMLNKFPNNHIFDLQIMACALAYEIDIIYTKNLKDFPIINEIKIIDPLQ